MSRLVERAPRTGVGFHALYETGVVSAAATLDGLADPSAGGDPAERIRRIVDAHHAIRLARGAGALPGGLLPVLYRRAHDLLLRELPGRPARDRFQHAALVVRTREASGRQRGQARRVMIAALDTMSPLEAMDRLVEDRRNGSISRRLAGQLARRRAPVVLADGRAALAAGDGEAAFTAARLLATAPTSPERLVTDEVRRGAVALAAAAIVAHLGALTASSTPPPDVVEEAWFRPSARRGMLEQTLAWSVAERRAVAAARAAFAARWPGAVR